MSTTYYQGSASPGSALGQQVPLSAVRDPGAYLCNWSGHLLRVVPDALTPGRSPSMMITGGEPLMITMLSADPFLGLSDARRLAAQCDLNVNF